MTEDEAKSKVCCGPLQFASATAWQHKGSVNLPASCVASKCMAWRWWEPWTSQAEEGQGGDLVIRLKRKPGEPRLGFCGLAGAPSQ